MDNDLTFVRDVLERAARTSPRDRDVLRALASVTAVLERFAMVDREELDKLNKLVQDLRQPPLQYGVYLGGSPAGDTQVIVGLGGTRIEAWLADELLGEAAQLVPGQEVVLNKEQVVVAARSARARGETAEVVNVLKPEGAAAIVSVPEDGAVRPYLVQAKWREFDEKPIELEWDADGRSEALQAGDIVMVDESKTRALARVRPRLHVKTSGSEGMVVEISDGLYAAGVGIGDIVSIDPGLKFAFEKLPSYETGELALEEVPDVTYDDIGGLAEQIAAIRDAIELPYLNRTLFERFQLARPKGILLYGPPGCGKTMVAKAVANSLTQGIQQHLKTLRGLLERYLAATKEGGAELAEIEAALRANDITPGRARERLQEIRAAMESEHGIRSYFLNIKGPELLDKYVGETEHRIRKIFEEAKRHATYYTPVVIFFDEMEAMFRTRGTGRSSDVETTIVPQFLSEIDGVESAPNVILIGASNRHDMIDPAILRPGRLDVKIRVDRPDRAAARDIFARTLLPTLPLDEAGLTLPADVCRPGGIVFATAYPRESADPAVATIATLLPVGCDVRLALSLSDVDLDALGRCEQALTVRQVCSHLMADDDPASLLPKLLRFRGATTLTELTTSLRQVRHRYAADPEMAGLLAAYQRREWVAELLIEAGVDVLYNPASTLSVFLRNGNRVSMAVRDTLSGATIANIVARAKRGAVKRCADAATLVDGDGGLRLDDVREAILQEFQENKDQLAIDRAQTDLGYARDDVQHVELSMTTGAFDPWSVEKPRPYRAVVLT